MRFENTEVFNIEGALRGMRNPLNSWAKSDSGYKRWCLSLGPDEEPHYCTNCHFDQCMMSDPEFVIGPNDMDLCRRLINGGPEHRKFLRQIFVSVDITAPLYWWKEFDTYKVGTTANSTSTMHKLASTPITLECFETDDYCGDLVYHELSLDQNELPLEYNISDIAEDIVVTLERLRQKYLETKDKRYWKELVRWLPNGWLQTRTVTMNYENLRTMYHQRKGHKLSEWKAFCEWVESLPYAKELIID